MFVKVDLCFIYRKTKILLKSLRTLAGKELFWALLIEEMGSFNNQINCNALTWIYEKQSCVTLDYFQRKNQSSIPKRKTFHKRGLQRFKEYIFLQYVHYSQDGPLET